MSLLESFEIDGTKWEAYEGFDDDVIYQRDCERCDRGLLLAPARFCPTCRGSGYLTTCRDPRANRRSEP